MTRHFDEFEDLAVAVATEIDSTKDASSVFFVDILDEALIVIESNPKLKNVKTLANLTWTQMYGGRK